MGGVYHDRLFVESELFRCLRADAVHPVMTNGQNIQHEHAKLRATLFKNGRARENRLPDCFRGSGPADVTGDLGAQRRADVDFGETGL